MLKNAFAKDNGIILADASPSGIEKKLVTTIEDALSGYRKEVKITPLLKIEKETDDLSGDVDKGFGAIVLTHSGGTVIHIPFMIYDSKMLPFDSIRLGEQQTPYDKGKLQKIIKTLTTKRKENDGDDFKIMELAEIEDIPYDNGFLGTILNVRNQAFSRGSRGNSVYGGVNSTKSLFNEEVMKIASDSILEQFEEFHEKLAAVKTYTNQNFDNVIKQIEKQAAEDYMSNLEKKFQDEKESQRIKSLLETEVENQKVIPMTEAVNGQHIEFPVFKNDMKERSIGKIFKNITRITSDNIFEIKPSNYKKKAPLFGVESMVVDKDGNYQLLLANDKPLAYQKSKYDDVKLATAAASSMKTSTKAEYSILISKETMEISLPFSIVYDFVSSEDRNGSIKLFNESFKDGGTFVTTDNSSIIANVLQAQSEISGTREYGDEFHIMVIKPSVDLEERLWNTEELKIEVIKRTVDFDDKNAARVIMDSMYKKQTYVIKADTRVLAFNNNKINLVTPNTDRGHSKVAGFNDLNTVTVKINDYANPKTFDVKIDVVSAEEVEGAVAKKLNESNFDNISSDAYKNILKKLGFNYTDIEKAEASLHRTGNQITLKLPNPKLAKNISVESNAKNKAKEAVKNILKSTFKVNNYTPIMQDVISDGLASTANAIMKAADSSLETAQAFEKLAIETKEETFAKVAYLLNTKHHLDKFAAATHTGYTANAMPLLDCVRGIEKSASLVAEELFYSEHDALPYELQKEAMSQLDGLMHHISVSKRIVKTAALEKFRKGI